MLRLSAISKTYPNGVRALQGIDLTIEKGLFGLLGPNGAGKSTLMRILATLQLPDEGQLLFDGVDVLAAPQAHRRHLGYLPQDFGVYPGVSAVELLDHLGVLKGLTNARQRREQVDALLHQTNLHAHRKKAVSGFSGGMRQRFGIAQALLGQPRMLIVDEPTAGLDPEERNRFHNLLSEVAEDIVVLLSTHIVEDVRQLCPRMAILSGGRVLREGIPEQLVTELTGRVWRKTVEKLEVPALRASQTVLSTQLSGGRTVLRVLADEAPAPGFERVPPDLEDVYFAALVGHGR
ncbi:multidrug ABC transporter ATP-binding protein [Myxococcus xanthus]|uniref:Multidrug ABC transporter ATP-binding protein n=1 Tax=Myxococcus xanthus TaxID=34 RepID=A0AAE6G7B6_MYXXA|nr:ABC transporter ATP-binding protein [Myxococcus xanthus]QDE72266.1 multidrug ABC transporter ATP-binding protein [Myxococcus xanthus]QDE73397.1 multidrug ABC transporter ATP-binding protein [Myxococcus xanthus]